MNERCRCGAELISELSFCVTCGAPRPALPAMAAAGRHGPPAPVGPAPAFGRPTAPSPALRPMPPRAPAPFPMSYPVPAPMPAHAPPAPRSSSAPWIVGAASIVVLAVLGALLVVTMRPAVVHTAAPVRPSTTVVTPTTVTAAPYLPYDTSSSSRSDTTSGDTGRSTGTGSSTSTEALNDQVSTDHGAVEAVTDRWVPQLSSKRVGTVADGVTYDAATILSHYQGLAASHAGAKLIWSGDWPVFRESDYWVVVVAQPFATADAANSWCGAQGLGPDDCFAKKLSHSGGPQGSTKTRS